MCPDEKDDEVPESPEIAVIRALNGMWRGEVDRMRAEHAEILAQYHHEQHDPDLRPLGQLVSSSSEYEAARRAVRNKTLRVVAIGNGEKPRLLSTPAWVNAWRRLTGRWAPPTISDDN
jgi:hypothetical protein